MTAGIPQDSTLGPLLWNILYDDALRLEFTEGATTAAFADDLALVVTAGDIDELTYRVNESLWCTGWWMKSNNLEVFIHKTEGLIIIKGVWKDVPQVTFKMSTATIEPMKKIVYLGIVLDQKLSFKEHIEYASTRAE